jgi:hypothetical protein
VAYGLTPYPGPEKSICSGQLRSLHRALQNVELMAESGHLNLKGGLTCEGNHALLPVWPLTLEAG